MKSTHAFSKIGSLVLGGLVACALGVMGAGFTPAAPALAAPPLAAPPLAAGPTPPPAKGAANERLQKAYQQEQARLATEAASLSQANDAAAKTQALIDAQKAKGADTTALEAALGTFKSQVALAQSSHDTASDILSAHAGFDGSGNLTDAAQATQTVTTAQQSLTDTHTVLAQATRDLRAAAQDFRQGKVQQNRLAREQKWLSTQQAVLDKTANVATKTQTFIDNQKAKGKDTAALEAALATFKQQVATAQAAHATAASLLSAHAGFDASGNVTDPTQAHQTLVAVHQSLTDAHTTLVQAGLDLRKAVQAYRAANPPAKTNS